MRHVSGGCATIVKTVPGFERCPKAGRFAAAACLRPSSPLADEVEGAPILIPGELPPRCSLRGGKSLQPTRSSVQGRVERHEEELGCICIHGPERADQTGRAAQEQGCGKPPQIVADVEPAQRGLTGTECDEMELRQIG